jgi:hypothetical protein
LLVRGVGSAHHTFYWPQSIILNTGNSNFKKIGALAATIHYKYSQTYLKRKQESWGEGILLAKSKI